MPVVLRPPLNVLATLACGVGGGALFAALGLPMPWLLGAIVGAAAAAMAGLPAGIPGGLRNIILVILGLMIGSGIHRDTLAHVSRWPVSMAAVAVYVGVVTTAMYHFLRRFAGFDPVTAFFAASPGGILAMTVIGGAYGGRERGIALTHAVRIVLVLFTIIFSYHLLLGVGSNLTRPGTGAVALTGHQIMLLILIGAAGWLLGACLRLPAGAMLGPLLLIAVAQLLGVGFPPLPAYPLLLAEVVLGSGIGADFAGVKPRELLRGMILSLAATLGMLSLSLLFSLVVRALTGMPLDALFLALSPGGLSGVSLVALALGIEPAFVTAHNLLRILLILLAGPLVFRVIDGGGHRLTEGRKVRR
jgi:membrane AbrB-like protein